MLQESPQDLFLSYYTNEQVHSPPSHPCLPLSPFLPSFSLVPSSSSSSCWWGSKWVDQFLILFILFILILILILSFSLCPSLDVFPPSLPPPLSQEKHILGTIDLKQCQGIRQLPREKEGRKHVVHLISLHRDYFISCDSIQLQQDWFDLINGAFKRHNLASDDLPDLKSGYLVKQGKNRKVSPPSLSITLTHPLSLSLSYLFT